MKFCLYLNTLLALSFGSALTQDYDTSQPAEKLKFDYNLGTEYLQSMEMIQKSKMNLGGQEMEQDMTMEMDMLMTVAGADQPGHKKVTIVYKRMAMTMDMMGQKMAFDSDEPDPNNPLGAGLSEIVDKKLIMLVDPKNEVIKVDGMEELVGDNPLAAKMVNEDMMKQSMNLWLTEGFPKKPIKAGDSWPLDVDMPASGIGDMKVDGKYNHLGHTKVDGAKCIVLGFNGKMEMNLDPGDDAEGPEAMAGMGMKIEGGTQDGKMFWDNELGYYRSMEMIQNLMMTMKNPVDGTPMNMPMNQTIKMTVKVK